MKELWEYAEREMIHLKNMIDEFPLPARDKFKWLDGLKKR